MRRLIVTSPKTHIFADITYSGLLTLQTHLSDYIDQHSHCLEKAEYMR